MQINQTLLDTVNSANAQLLVVTKYWDAKDTQVIMDKLKNERCVFGWGENRINSLKDKASLKKSFNFIGRLQSRQLPVILEHCWIIHSLDNLKHAKKIDQLMGDKKKPSVDVFVQVNTSGDPAKGGISADDLPSFLEIVFRLKNINIIGLSSMGWGDFLETEKREEFRQLVDLRNKYLSYGLTSAGTSRDYHLALEEGIDVIRVGKGIVK